MTSKTLITSLKLQQGQEGLWLSAGFWHKPGSAVPSRLQVHFWRWWLQRSPLRSPPPMADLWQQPKKNCVFTGAECWQCPLGCVRRERKGQAARKKIARQILAKAALGRVSQQDAPSPNPLLVLSIQCYLCLQLARALCRSRSPGTSCHPSRGLQVDGEQQRVQGEHRWERGLLALGATRVLSGGKKKEKLIDGVVAQSPCSDSVTYASQWQIMLDCAWKLQKCWAGRWGSYPLPSKYHLLVLLTV